jgi:hypothetical protein
MHYPYSFPPLTTSRPDALHSGAPSSSAQPQTHASDFAGRPTIQINIGAIHITPGPASLGPPLTRHLEALSLLGLPPHTGQSAHAPGPLPPISALSQPQVLHPQFESAHNVLPPIDSSRAWHSSGPFQQHERPSHDDANPHVSKKPRTSSQVPPAANWPFSFPPTQQDLQSLHAYTPHNAPSPLSASHIGSTTSSHEIEWTHGHGASSSATKQGDRSIRVTSPSEIERNEIEDALGSKSLTVNAAVTFINDAPANTFDQVAHFIKISRLLLRHFTASPKEDFGGADAMNLLFSRLNSLLCKAYSHKGSETISASDLRAWILRHLAGPQVETDFRKLLRQFAEVNKSSWTYYKLNRNTLVKYLDNSDDAGDETLKFVTSEWQSRINPAPLKNALPDTLHAARGATTHQPQLNTTQDDPDAPPG